MLENFYELDNVEVRAIGVSPILEAFKGFTLLASQIMLGEGFGRSGSDGTIDLEANAWYPVKGFLNSLQKIGAQVGEHLVYEGGLAIPKYAAFPPDVRTVHDAMNAIDLGYHMNHRKNGREMFNPMTGEMQEGIGHYRYQKLDVKKGVMVCESPYPCEYDRGVLTTFVRRFEPNGMVVHDNTKPCRKKSGFSCTFQISWR